MSPVMSLNARQQLAYQAILEGKSIFLTGSGGTGKSYLLSSVYDTFKREGKRGISLTALTGCAALLLHPTARTLHSWAGIGLGQFSAETLIEKTKRNRRAVMRWKMTDCLVIDEVSMMTPELFEKLDAVGRAIRKRPVPFGGLQLVLVGDFFQLPPVMRGETMFVFESPLWATLALPFHELIEIHRQKDPVFQAILTEARHGTLSKESLLMLGSRVGLDYSGLKIQPSMVFTRRAEVHDLNLKHFSSLKTESYTYIVKTVADSKAALKNPFAESAIEKLDKTAPYHSEITLAVGAQVMLITNLQEQGLVNGSRGVVVGFGSDPSRFPKVEFLNGVILLVEPAKWGSPDVPELFRSQIPLILAYAVTVHKTQGSTLDCALIDIGRRTFEYGQAYVALSRVKEMESLYVHDLDAEAFRAHPKVKAFYAHRDILCP